MYFIFEMCIDFESGNFTARCSLICKFFYKKVLINFKNKENFYEH